MRACSSPKCAMTAEAGGRGSGANMCEGCKQAEWGYSNDIGRNGSDDEQVNRHEGSVCGSSFRPGCDILCVRWYLCYKLSFRDLVEMMAERGLHLSHTTIMRWA